MRMYDGYFEIKRLEDKIDAMDVASVELLSSGYDRLNKKIAKLETENKRLKARVELLEEALDCDD